MDGKAFVYRIVLSDKRYEVSTQVIPCMSIENIRQEIEARDKPYQPIYIKCAEQAWT